jgi:hypothetical protein
MADMEFSLLEILQTCLMAYEPMILPSSCLFFSAMLCSVQLFVHSISCEVVHVVYLQ